MKTKVLLIAALMSLSSCYYYRVVPQDPYTAQSITQFEQSGKTLVLHRADKAWHLYDVQFTDSLVHARLDIQLGYLVNHLYPREEGLNKFDKPLEPEVINTVHLYTTDTTFNALDTMVSIPLSQIYAVRSYEYARAASRASKIVPVVVLPVVGLVAVSLIALSQMDFSVSMY